LSETLATRAQRFSKLFKTSLNQLATALLLIALPLALSGCGNDEWEWKQKLTIEVNTPNGVVSGSSVVRIVAYESPEVWIIGFPGSVGSSVIGEAVVVEVAPGKYLFALLRGIDEEKVFAEYFEDIKDKPFAIRMERTASIRDKRELDTDRYPTLVTFGDINDPKTVKKVDPNDLAASFGKGFSLKSITAEILDPSTPITQGKVGKVLGWLDSVGGGTLDGRKMRYADGRYGLANSLSRNEFRVKQQ